MLIGLASAALLLANGRIAGVIGYRRVTRERQTGANAIA